MVKLGAKELRRAKPTEKELASIKRIPLYIILDNVLDTYNVGAIFRLADAVGAQKVFLCGGTETPPNPKIKKASVGTWRWVAWEQAKSAAAAIKKLKVSAKGGSAPGGKSENLPARLAESKRAGKAGLKVIAVEQNPKSIAYDKAKYNLPLAIVVGHETEGISREALKLADEVVELPLWGVNKSLNVMVSAAIVLFKIMEQVTSSRS